MLLLFNESINDFSALGTELMSPWISGGQGLESEFAYLTSVKLCISCPNSFESWHKVHRNVLVLQKDPVSPSH